MAFSLNETTLLNAIRGGGLLSIINSTLSPGYGIYNSNIPTKALTPTSFIGVEVVKDSAVTIAPVEKGTYSSYNKVNRPGEIRVTFAFEGWTGFSGAIPNLTNFSLASRTDILSKLDEMVEGANLYDIETPDTTYQNYDLTHYDYRTSSQEVTILIVSAVFQSIRDMGNVTLSNATGNEVEPGNNADIKSANGRTVMGNSGVTASTLTDVKGALSGLKNSLSSAATKVATSVSSSINESTSGITGAINGAATSSINKLSEAVTELVSGLS
ncbi:phage baseplate protein [Serratia marcescens]|uniref:Putative bacterial contaminant n=1 Tax=Rhodnius prolixus TaxID=13249 RepID=R4G3U2_RHOPR|nr:hypothetical protein [Serratia marcescens]RZF18824.1 hypothetical protein B7L32_03585 [Serratia marcescens]